MGRDGDGRNGALLRTGISVVDVATTLLDEKADQRIVDVSVEELDGYNPAQVEQRPVRCAQLDSIPWPCRPRVLGATAALPRSMGDETTCQREFTPAEHVAHHWNCNAGAPREAHPLGPGVEIPEGILSSLRWMKECADFEGWAVAQVRRWQRIARQLEPARAKWRSELARDVAAVLPPEYDGPLHREMQAAAGHQDLNLCSDIERGFPVAGVLPDTLQFQSIPAAAMPRFEELD